MDQAAQMANRTIAIVSPSYLGSHFTRPEWSATFAHDPEGQRRKLIPVRVAPSDAEGLLGQIVRIDLVGLTREGAKAALLAGLNPGRAKPGTEPSFPGGTVTPADAASRPQAVPDLTLAVTNGTPGGRLAYKPGRPLCAGHHGTGGTSSGPGHCPAPGSAPPQSDGRRTGVRWEKCRPFRHGAGTGHRFRRPSGTRSVTAWPSGG